MKKSLLLLLGAASVCGSVSAASLTPDQAFALAANQSRRLSNANAGDYHVAYTLTDQLTSANTLYVFTKAGAQGFAIVAADDAVDQLLLGYSDESVFDATNIPPSMMWWLQACGQTVTNTVNGQSTIPAVVNCQPRLRSGASRSDHESISPIVKTKWGQDSPYNNMCPMLGSKRAVTGCVATALAQVMKVHEWPLQGVGSHSYTFKYNNTTYSASADFGSTTYDWDHMVNTYNNSTPKVSKDAVATLMLHCGVASNMQYSPYGSGTSEVYAGAGLIDFFNYDKGVKYLQRTWFTADEWDNIVYDQLAQGLPVLYTGVDAEREGHAFVCDGYSENGYYHINWGWDGLSDGYFLLANLNPDDQGTGGSSSGSAFNFSQSILADVKKPVEGSQVAATMAMGDNPLTTGKSKYNRTSLVNVKFNGGFFSYTLKPVSATLGLRVIGEGVDKYVDSGLGYYTLNIFEGFSSFEVKATRFPIGEYDVYPAFKTEDGEWQMMYYNKELFTQPLHFVVTQSKIEITNQYVSGDATAVINGNSPENPADTGFYPNHSYNFNVTVTTTGYWDNDVALYMVDAAGNFVTMSNVQNVATGDAASVGLTLKLTIPANTPEGSYNVAVGYLVDNNTSIVAISEFMPIAVGAQEGVGTLSSVSVEFVGAERPGTSTLRIADIYNSADQEIKVTLQCQDNPWGDYVGLAFANYSTGSIISMSPTQEVVLEPGVPQTLTFTGPWDDLEVDTKYIVAPWGQNNGQLGSRLFYVKIIEQKPQTITWDQEAGDVASDAVVTLNATATSGLAVTYEIVSGNDIADLSGKTLTIHGVGAVEVKASQAGDRKWQPAEPVVKTFNAVAGINDIYAEGVRLAVEGNVLLISGVAADKAVSVYTVDGRCAYMGTDRKIVFAPGLYMVACGASQTKIFIR